jgi:hypothetical protein
MYRSFPDGQRCAQATCERTEPGSTVSERPSRVDDVRRSAASLAPPRSESIVYRFVDRVVTRSAIATARRAAPTHIDAFADVMGWAL